MKFTDCGRFLIASSARGRELLVFDIQADAKTTPVYVISLSGTTASIATKTLPSKSSNGTSGDLIEILVIFAEKNSCIYRVASNYAENEKEGLKTVFSTTKIVSSSPIMAGFLGAMGSSNGKGAFMAVGQTSRPMFVHIDIEDSNGSSIEQINLSDVVNIPMEGGTNGSVDHSSDAAGTMVVAPVRFLYHLYHLYPPRYLV